jgi:aldehyde:ferredoxin oxidoreductase
LPWKLVVPVADGSAKGSVVGAEEWQLGLTGYYAAQGWTPQGVPTAQTLQQLGLISDLKLLEASN